MSERGQSNSEVVYTS